MKWIKNLIRKVCEWNIIMSKTTLVSMDLIDESEAMNKTFKDKIDNPTTKASKLEANGMQIGVVASQMID